MQWAVPHPAAAPTRDVIEAMNAAKTPDRQSNRLLRRSRIRGVGRQTLDHFSELPFGCCYVCCGGPDYHNVCAVFHKRVCSRQTDTCGSSDDDNSFSS